MQCERVTMFMKGTRHQIMRFLEFLFGHVQGIDDVAGHQSNLSTLKSGPGSKDVCASPHVVVSTILRQNMLCPLAMSNQSFGIGGTAMGIGTLDTGAMAFGAT
jgi:hypothetical protein